METVAAVLQVVLAVVFLGAGASKVLGTRMQIENFDIYRYPQSFRSVYGTCGVNGAVAMLAGLFVDEVAVFAGVWLAVTMAVAVYTDFFRRGSLAYALAPAVLLILALAVVARRVG